MWQASGKSSVLEGLTELPFPRDSGLCTRFATQITFRRAANESVNVSIIPASTSSQERKERLRGFQKRLAALDGEEFVNILSQVSS